MRDNFGMEPLIPYYFGNTTVVNSHFDDIKRMNRINNLKLNMVKELLFDKFIYMLSEPKKISKKKLSITNLITDNNVIDTISPSKTLLSGVTISKTIVF